MVRGVVGDLVAARAVAAGDGLGENAVLVGHRNRHAVDLVFDGVFDRFAVHELADAGVEFVQLRFVVDIVDREHRDAMLDRFESFDRGATDLLGRAVGRIVLGMLGLEFHQPSHQLVELEVGDFGLRLDEVEPIMPPQLVAELFDFGLDRVGHRAGFSDRTSESGLIE